MNDDIRAAARKFYADNAAQHLDCDRDLLIDRCSDHLAQQFEITEDSALVIAAAALKQINPSIIVVGKPGCGKTTNAKRIRDALGLERIIDEPRCYSRFPKIPAFNVLVLTTDEDVPAIFPGMKSITYVAAMDAVAAYEARRCANELPAHTESDAT
ncbi:MAG: hypothetical protein ABL934_03125 [Lysobacteraceae bacterium]